MGARSAADIEGLEYDWFACDGDGCVALFSTAGGGFAPDAFLRDTDAHDAALEALLASEASTRARFAPEVAAGLQNTWRLVAQRGVFAFESDPSGGPYRVVAAPEHPARAAQLPGAMAAVAGAICLPHLRFSELSSISREMLARRSADG